MNTIRESLVSAQLNSIKARYDAHRLSCTECFHELKTVCGTWYNASQVFSRFWMDRP